jgi:hypothetical protein
MKTGTTLSPCLYDAVTRHALESANLRWRAILRYASSAAFSDFAGRSGYRSIAAMSLNPEIDVMGQLRPNALQKVRRNFAPRPDPD